MNNWQNIPSLNSAPLNFGDNYSPYYASSSNAGKLINSIGGYLAPAQAFTTLNPYDQYAAPSNEALKLFEQMSLRPEFERTQLNPFNRQYGNQAATSNSFMMGSAKNDYQNALGQVEQPYQNQLLTLQSQLDTQNRNLYNQMLQDYLNSPTSFTNIGMTTSPYTTNNAIRTLT